MKTKQLKIFTNKNGRLLWAINVESDGRFAFVNYNKSRYTATKQQLREGWFEGSVPKYVREYAIQCG